MPLRSDLRALGSLVLLMLAAVGVVALMPLSWIAEPPSSEPRSMMGSGFVNDRPDVAPWTWWWSGWIDLRVDRPDETNIVIWNHHTEAMQAAPSCMGSAYFPPPAIMALEAIGRTRVYYLCTKATQDRAKPFYALQRRDEILALVHRFRALGVPAGRIFLAGQSGGACSSLFALGARAEDINAGILFAPACIGPREGQDRKLGLAGAQQRRVEAEMVRPKRVRALLVAFRGERWNPPDTLGFLTRRYPETVRLYSPPCAPGHGGAFFGCGVEAVGHAVRRYFLERLAAAGYPAAGEDGSGGVIR